MTTLSFSDIQNAFVDCNLELPNDSIASSCIKLCNQFGLDLTEFTHQLDAFLCHCGKENKFNTVLIQKFEEAIRNNTNKKKAAMDKNKKFNEKKSYNTIQTPSSNTYKKKFDHSSTITPVVEHDISSILTTPYHSKTNYNTNHFTPSQAQSQSQHDNPNGTSPSGTSINNFQHRTNSGEFVIGYNENLGKRMVDVELSTSSPLGLRSECIMDINDFDNVKQRFRYMFTSLHERNHANEMHFHAMELALLEIMNLNEDDLHPVGSPSQNTVWICGRICCEEAGAIKMNATSVMIEGGPKSMGRKAHLDLSSVSQYALFPGQIVLVEGLNSTGRKMVAKRIIDSAPCAPAKSLPSRLLEYHHSSQYQGGAPLHVMTAAGPFTTSDNLSYEPLTALLVHALRNKPDVLILIGPFVDISQPIIASGEMTVTSEDNDGNQINPHSASYEMVFIEKIIRDGIRIVFDADDEIPTQIILIPSLLDAHHEFVYPQPPFGSHDSITSEFFEEKLGELDIPYSGEKDRKKRVHLMSNPCVFRINEVLFGVTSHDILHSLSSEEIAYGRTDHRLSRLMSHMINQQSFAPQFPASIHSSAQIDYRQAGHFTFKTTPDILITPSKLTHLARGTGTTLVINPGQLSKGSSGGTFADITVHPFQKELLQELKSKEPLTAIPHGVYTRTRVIISKI